MKRDSFTCANRRRPIPYFPITLRNFPAFLPFSVMIGESPDMESGSLKTEKECVEIKYV